MSEVQTDGGTSSQVPVLTDAENDVMAEQPASDPRFDDINAKFDMLADGFNELKSYITKPSAPDPVEEEYDDDEPLTGSKVNRIVKKAISTAVHQSTATNDRQVWDSKAKEEYPITDPQFQRELKRVWNEMRDSGLDAQHPKALYLVAKTTAQRLGTKKAVKTTSTSAQTSEAPTTTRSPAPTATKQGMVPPDDRRIELYAASGRKTKEDIEAFRTKLFNRDARKK